LKKAARIAGALVLAAGLLLVGGAGPFRSTDAERGPVPAAGASSFLAPAVSGSLERTIESLQDRLRRIPSDWRSFASLGFAYVQQARITANPSFYPKAESVLRRSLDLNRVDNYEAMIAMAALFAARHDFAAALRWGERARAVNPYDGNVYGVLGDAFAELGRYEEAVASFQRMVDTLPGLASYARVSYARELRGDVPGAMVAMRAALDLAGTPADAAWASFQLGELYFNRGRIDRAAAQYRRARKIDPTAVLPRAGLAKVAWARGDLETAIRGYTAVTRRSPTPEHVIALGDLYAVAGDETAAAGQYELVRVEERLFRSNGVNIDLEQALFEADHGDAAGALEAAREEWSRRRSIHVADALAWALYANGRYAEAAGYADRALALGTRNALFLFHAGMIRLRLGDAGTARPLLAAAVRTNPYFSIRYAEVARRELARLGGRA
jgi:tetratricopeptide (TPR) repeat protein